MSPNPAQLIANERNNTFDHKSMHEFVEGSITKSDLVLELFSSIERDPSLSSDFNEYDQTANEEREKVANRIAKMAYYLETEDHIKSLKRLNLVTIYDASTGIRIGVNTGLFLNCIKGNGTASQYEFWGKHKEAGMLKQIYGCFAMTELTHGSNVAGCETTAIFDKEKDQFVINTPHIGATKWWIGGAAHSATHSVVYARLIVDGKDHGVKTFIVPLRDSNHELMPGISVGDIGAKMGRTGVDNGWIQYSQVRIPRYFMLHKWCQVSRDGQVTTPPLEQLSYISLLSGRVLMATDSYRISARFVTIAIRYAVGRTQFKLRVAKESASETQLIDYPLHQRRLLPYLAVAYAMAIGSSNLEAQHARVNAELDRAVEANDEAGIHKAIADVKDLFIDSGAVKATYTWTAATCIDEMRQACGGHGYSAYNGFGKAYSDWVVQCTWEGDNNVLSLSVGKSILKNLEAVQKGKKVSMKYLSQKDKGGTVLENLAPENILQAVEILIIRIGLLAAKTVQQEGGVVDKASVACVTLSKLKCHQFTLSVFIEAFNQVQDPNLKARVKDILQLYALTSVLEPFSGEFICYDVIEPSIKKEATYKAIPELLTKIRPYCIELTDSFMLPDKILNSAIGMYDGNIYENYFGVVKKQNPSGENCKAPYSKVIEDMLNRKLLEERLRFETSKEAEEMLSK